MNDKHWAVVSSNLASDINVNICIERNMVLWDAQTADECLDYIQNGDALLGSKFIIFQFVIPVNYLHVWIRAALTGFEDRHTELLPCRVIESFEVIKKAK